MGASLKIAIADDEPAVRDYFAAALAEWWHRVVVVASSGQELVEKCRIERPDLLVTDIRMDGVGGIDAMRTLSLNGPLPTILISDHYLADDLDDRIADQVLAFLPKPVKIADLSAAVSAAASRLA